MHQLSTARGFIVKFIYDIKSIMASSWQIAREKASKPGNTKSLRECHKRALRYVWQKANYAMKQQRQHEENRDDACARGNRYIELLSVAIDSGLQHGKSWICEGHETMTTGRKGILGVPDTYLGKEICYIYTRTN